MIESPDPSKKRWRLVKWKSSAPQPFSATCLTGLTSPASKDSKNATELTHIACKRSDALLVDPPESFATRNHKNVDQSSLGKILGRLRNIVTF